MSSSLWPTAAREAQFHAWLQPLIAPQRLLPESLALASVDASTRRYLRMQQQGGGSVIVMDAPPDCNDVRPFVAIARHMADCGLRVPAVLAENAERGFLLLGDLGTQTYLQALLAATPAEADRLMRAAIQALIQWQQRGDATRLPAFDESFVRRELQIFVDWCVQHHYGKTWDAKQQGWWEHCCKVLVSNIQQQPQLAMHRDYMPRNLMTSLDGVPGVLDFQDAVCGPIAYDMAALLRDAFISWDEERELDWAIRYWEQARKAGLPVGEDFGEYWRALELTGLQRHLKILGLYCRLNYRDGKPAYIADLPRFFAYAIKVSTRYIELSPLTHLLEDLQGGLTQTGFNLR
ncbi:phosphotransferase [Pelomonas sp. V22]|uniref:aminoglycoside phosphotransferase family protein n=1 Tax=Pelomonas sp. V22 TaxID=2822139 RepID=UPI0024A9CF79|nr:phosphotransferase [Pelomonas sp. V22]MDI4634798.1 phosphotransferase [Pelomonas sp. V22]